MRRTTKKLSGVAKHRFLRQLLAGEPSVPAEAAERLAARGADAITSLRVKRTHWALLKSTPGRGVVASAAKLARGDYPPPFVPVPPPLAAGTVPVSAGPMPFVPPAAAPFDPYQIGLVPTFQREGRDGLVTKLVAVGNADSLRKIARAQQVTLPDALRGGDVAIDTLAGAIADAVAKRIADRRAAAS